MANSTNGLFKYYAGLPKWGKATVIIGGAAVTIYAVYAVIKSYNNAANLAKSQQEVTGFVKDLNDLSAQGISPTYQQSQYQQWADSIAAQFAGCDASFALPGVLGMPLEFSNSGDVVNGIVLQLKNNADFLALQSAFGIRSISKHWWCGGDYNNVSLSAAITDQLSSIEINQLNANMAANGITYTL